MCGKACRQRRQERRGHLQAAEAASAAAGAAADEVPAELDVKGRIFSLELMDLSRARIVVRNTFLDIDEPRVGEPRRRDSAPAAVLSLIDTEAAAAGRCAPADSDMVRGKLEEETDTEADTLSMCSTDSMSMGSTDTWKSLASDALATVGPLHSTAAGGTSQEDALMHEKLSGMLDLTEEDLACIVVRNTFLEVGEQKGKEPQRRRSETCLRATARFGTILWD